MAEKDFQRWLNNPFAHTPVPAEVIEALRKFAAANGRCWKSKLRTLWNTGKDDGLLRQARNIIGPNEIDKIVL